jgi:quercetin dioxygenase-like cupin family protein
MKGEIMQVVDLNDVETFEVDERLSVAFPVSSATGTAATATVWMEIAPGGEVGEHTDTAEELLYIVRGEVEASVGDETGIVRAGDLVVVPALAPHSFRNRGDGDARILGFFGGSTNIGTFTRPNGNTGARVFVVGGPVPIMLPLDEPVEV